jgi:tRNA pseudouridine38-40 synthase
MPRFKVVLAYDGTDFVGWQRQPSGESIQGVLEEALHSFDDRDVTVIGAGRTDAGVHAIGQVAAFSLRNTIDAETLARALNAKLPEAIRVLSACEVAETFNPRYDARAKTYRYRIWNGRALSPFERRYAWQVPVALDAGAMDAAARRLEGRHDFAAFQAQGSDVVTTERTMTSSRVSLRDELLTYEVTGDGFLRHMVRAVVGTLVEIGRGRRPVEWIDEVIASRDRPTAGPTVPATGLFLVRVDYGEYCE